MGKTDKRITFFITTTLVLMLLILLIGFGVIDFKFSSDSKKDSASEPAVSSSQEFEYSQSPLKPVSDIVQDTRYTESEKENISVYDRYNKAVVNISTEVLSYNWFLEPVPRKGSSGSGSIIDDRGYILTNNHVVENAYKVNVVLAGGETVEGEVIGTDKENDLAVIKFNPGKQSLVTIPFGDSSTLRIGEKVLAIGNPFAFERTLTVGIISGLGRPLRNDKGIVIKNLIQTDASINPGNSGGPLLNSRGEIIGVNTMIYSPSGGSVGIGFAVPVETAKRVVPDLIQYGFVQRGWIEIEPVQLFPSLVRYAKLSVSKGILVSKVKKGGNALKAGIRGGRKNEAVRSGNTVIYLGGDIIIGVNGDSVESLGDLYSVLERSKPDEIVTVTLIRGKRKIDVDVKLTPRKDGDF